MAAATLGLTQQYACDMIPRMEIISSPDARRRGLKRYFTGRPCKYGHLAERWISTNGCVECTRDNARAWYWKNTEYAAEKNREWREANPAYAKQWANENAHKLRAAERRYYYNDTGRRRALSKAWEKANAEARAAIASRYRARLVSAPGSFTKDDIEALLEAQGYRCVGCGCDILRRFDIDHKIPLSRDGSNWPDNLQALCHPCNTSKGDKTMEEWLTSESGTEPVPGTAPAG